MNHDTVTVTSFQYISKCFLIGGVNPFEYVLKLVCYGLMTVIHVILFFFKVDNLILGALFFRYNLEIIESRDLNQVRVG